MPNAINAAQQEFRSIESQIAGGVLQIVNQTIYYPYWNISVLKFNQNITIVMLKGYEQLCSLHSSHFYTIYDSLNS